MSGVDKIPSWVWPAGVGLFGLIAVMGYLVQGLWHFAALVVAAILYAVGLGRDDLRRKLIARGVPVDDYLEKPEPHRTTG